VALNIFCVNKFVKKLLASAVYGWRPRQFWFELFEQGTQL